MVTRHPRLLIAAAVAALAIVDHLAESAGSSTLPGGPLDEAAHLLTTLIILCALRIPLATAFARGALVMSVLIDLDHVPGRLGSQFLTAGTPRPYTHSLLSVLVLLLLALWPRWRLVFLGAAFGLVVHLWRDLSESGSAVSLLWPITEQPTHSSHPAYLLVMLLLGAVAVLRAASGATAHSAHAGWLQRLRAGSRPRAQTESARSAE